MGVRIQELPETTGINKEDVLIVEDGQGTKKGTVKQLDEALGVSQLKEDLGELKRFGHESYNLLKIKSLTTSGDTTNVSCTIDENYKITINGTATTSDFYAHINIEDVNIDDSSYTFCLSAFPHNTAVELIYSDGTVFITMFDGLSKTVTGANKILNELRIRLPIGYTTTEQFNVWLMKGDSIKPYVSPNFVYDIVTKNDLDGVASQEDLEYLSNHSFTENEFVDITNTFEYHNSFMRPSGETASDDGSKTTDFLDVNAVNKLYLTSHVQFGTASICLFDGTKKCIGSFPTEDVGEKTYKRLKVSDYITENTYYVRLSSYNSTIKIEKEQRVSNDYVLSDLKEMNVLYGKKITFCGDSFTEGDFTGYVDQYGKSGINSDAYDKDYGMFKTYPYHIAKRNNLNLVMLAKCGAKITNATSNSFTLSTAPIYYENIPTDSDYITIAYGLNDSSVSIGNITDTDNTTWYGAFNMAMNWIINNVPKAKVLLISSDAWYSNTQRDCVRNVAHYWGVGFLDLKGSDVPMMLGSKYSQDGYTINSEVATLRQNQHQVSSSNSHPNLFSHEFRSTIIEDALRKL